MSPAYAASTASLPITCLNPGDSVAVLNAESIASGGKSQAVGLSPQRFGEGPKAFSVQLAFSGAPGTFEIDVEDADTDTDASYQLIPGGAITAVNSGNVGGGSFQTARKFVRLHRIDATMNSVTVTGTISR